MKGSWVYQLLISEGKFKTFTAQKQICTVSISPGRSEPQLFLAKFRRSSLVAREVPLVSLRACLCCPPPAARLSGSLSLPQKGSQRKLLLVSELLLVLLPQKVRFQAVACELCCLSVRELVAAFCHFWQRGRHPKGTEFQQDLWGSGAGWMTLVSQN